MLLTLQAKHVEYCGLRLGLWPVDLAVFSVHSYTMAIGMTVMTFIHRFSGHDALRRCALLILSTALLAFFSSCATSTKRSNDDFSPRANISVNEKEAGSQSDEGRFVLGPGDQVVVKVWRNSDLDRTTTIDPLGNLDIPLAGKIEARGLSPSQLGVKISDALSRYIINPRVDVNVVSLKSQRFHVFGEVRTPGSFTLDRQILVWEAIASAGGFTQDANRKQVLVIRTSLEKPKVDTFDILSIMKSGAIEGQLDILGGDILLIPPTKIASVERFMNRISTILRPVVTAEQGIILFPEVEDALSGKTTDGRSSFTVAP